jgi:hypothetical protein
MFGREILPEEPRLWRKIFGSERVEKLEWAFDEYMRIGKYFPRPADIVELLAVYSQRFGTPTNQWRKKTAEEIAALEAHKLTPEYQQAKKDWEDAWKRLGGQV